MRKPGSGACRRTRRPEGDDIILIFARRGNLIEHHCACAPIPLRFGPQIRSLFIEYGIVLIVVEMSIALHQAEALQGCIGKAVHLWTHRIVDRPPNSFSSAGTNGKAIGRSEEHTSELQSLMRNSYAVFSVKKKKK